MDRIRDGSEGLPGSGVPAASRRRGGDGANGEPGVVSASASNATVAQERNVQ